MNFKTIAIITLAATLSISLAGCGDVDAKVAQDASSEAQASVSALPVEVAAASKGDIFATYHTTTAISADAEAPVRRTGSCPSGRRKAAITDAAGEICAGSSPQ